MEVKENTSRSRGEDKEERDNVGGSGFDLEEMWTKGMLGMITGNNKEIYCLISTDL